VNLLILMCSIAKAVITLMGFIEERSKELVVPAEHTNVKLMTIISIASLILLIKKSNGILSIKNSQIKQ